MRRYWLWIVFCLCLLPELHAERKKVGLVLSGGGAKGIAHIGVIEGYCGGDQYGVYCGGIVCHWI